MKALTTKCLFGLALLIMAGFSVQAKELKKEINKRFTATSSSELRIENKFGQVTLVQGNSGEVVFDIVIKVDTPDDDQSQKLLDAITVNFNNDGNKIIAVTDIDEKISKMKSSGNRKMSINYTVQVPASIALNLENNFGDVVLCSLSGPVALELNYGHLSADKLTGSPIALELNYNPANIAYLAKASLDANYAGEVEIIKAENLSVELNYGTLSLGSVDALELEANYGKATIDGATGKGSVSIEVNMGSIDLRMLSGFSLDAEFTMGDIQYPDGMKNLVKNKKMGNVEVSGTYGDGKAEVSIEGNMSNAKISVK